MTWPLLDVRRVFGASLTGKAGTPRKALLEQQAWHRGPSWILPLILCLAVLRGGLYASLLPPWGLVDEEHHFHYVQHLAEQRAIPIVGRTYLSAEIINSLFATRRWEVFHWITPSSRDPRTMGLEGHSYEGYQPPLYYLLLVPLFRLLPDDLLVKLYGLRGAMVGLSLLSVWFAYRLTNELFPRLPGLAHAVALLLVAIPERTIAVSRINNDVLLEAAAAAFVWVFVRTQLKGLTVRRAQLLGLLLGLGILIKVTMGILAVFLPIVYWHHRRNPRWWRCGAWTLFTAAVLVLPLITRNQYLYGDLTGFAAFERLSPLPVRVLSVLGAAHAVGALFRSFWVVWWQGAAVGTHPVLSMLYGVLAVLTAMSAAGILDYLRQRYRQRGWDMSAEVSMAFLMVLACYTVAIVASYFAGSLPVIQGRLLLPVILPIVVLFGWGLWCFGRYGRAAIILSVIVLVAMDALSLFGNLLPYYYYWSAFVVNGVPQAIPTLSWPETWSLFYSRLLLDKPPLLRPLLPFLTAAYVFVLVYAGLYVATTLVRRPVKGRQPDQP